MSKLNLPILTRPNYLDDVTGHEKTKLFFKKRMKNKDYPQVMLFLGQTGIGKTTFQSIITKNILCQTNDRAGNACNTCEICKAIDSNKFLINYRSYNASNANIDEMREIENFLLEPIAFLGTNTKVVIIDEFQELYSNKKASKNLLKVLETPMSDVHIILGAMDETKIEQAIKDRATVFNLKPLTESEVADRLIQVCKQYLKFDNIENDEEKVQTIFLISENSGGSLRRAVSLLDTVIDSDLWKPEDFRVEMNMLSYEQINDIINKIMKGDVTVLNNTITPENLTDITYKLLTIFKILNGFEVPPYQKKSLAGINRFDIKKVEKTLEYLFGLGYFSGLNKPQIEFHILKIITMNKE